MFRENTERSPVSINDARIVQADLEQDQVIINLELSEELPSVGERGPIAAGDPESGDERHRVGAMD